MTLLGHRCFIKVDKDAGPSQEKDNLENAYKKLSKLEGEKIRSLKRELNYWKELVEEQNKAIKERECQLKEQIGAKREAQKLGRLQREAQAEQSKQYAKMEQELQQLKTEREASHSKEEYTLLVNELQQQKQKTLDTEKQLKAWKSHCGRDSSDLVCQTWKRTA